MRMCASEYRGLNWAYFMFNNRFRKYFRYAQMTSFIFETIIEFSAAIKNVYAQLVLMNRGLTSTYTDRQKKRYKI